MSVCCSTISLRLLTRVTIVFILEGNPVHKTAAEYKKEPFLMLLHQISGTSPFGRAMCV